jgi:predicted MFS family arabinose efflux permease
MADRTGRYWLLTVIGYAITAVSVPLLAVTPFLGGAGLAAACVLVLAERTGKAVRSPSKSTLLAYAASDIGRGRGFGVHKALDQIGSFTGPLIVAGSIGLTATLWPSLAVLAIPGVVAMVLLVWLRRRVGDPRPRAGVTARVGDVALPKVARLPREFYMFAASSGAATAGLVTFGVISFHLAHEHVVPVATVPLVYAAGMAVAAVAALATGFAYDRFEANVLYTLPFLIAVVPVLAFSQVVVTAVAGVLFWGAAVGVQDSTVKALVADLVPAERRATGYGVFAAIQGTAAMAGGALAGALYSRSVPALVLVVAACQVVALTLFVVTQRLRNRSGDNVAS